jgi:GT2 family glycosyltransferase
MPESEVKQPAVSVVVLIYSLNKELDEMAHNCVNSLDGQWDELIIVDNGSPEKYEWMEKKATKFIRLEENVGYVKGMNTGGRLATGKNIVYVTSDTKLIKGKLSDLCTQHICIPCTETDNKEYTPRVDGVFYAVPNHPLMFHDESFDFYFSDIDLFARAQKMGVKIEIVSEVVIYHKGWQTTSTEPDGTKKAKYDKDKQTFLNKWGYLPSGEEE